MKIRKLKRKYYWFVFPSSDKYKNKKFKIKKDALNYLNSMGFNALNSIIRREVDGISYSHSSFELCAWYNEYEYIFKKMPFKIVLKQKLFRGKKYIFKERKIEKVTVKYFTKSEQIINLMIHISNEYENNRLPSDSNFKNLIELFKYRFSELPNNSNGYGKGIEKLEDCEFWYWSDRCGWDRASVIIKCIQNERPHLLI